MSTTHTGKIGRLPKHIRHLLGERIEAGIPNQELVTWLNESEAVQDLLELRFGGRAITEQNLSAWKQTGHKEWVRREERRALALQWLEQWDEEWLEPEESAAKKEVSDRLGRELGLEMAGLALELVDQEGSTAERWQRLCAVYKEVSLLRRDDHRADQARIQRERWREEQARAETAAAEKEAQATKRQLLAACLLPVSVPVTAAALGGGEQARALAELMERIKADEDPERLLARFQEAQKGWGKAPGKPGCVRTGVADGPRRGKNSKRRTTEKVPSIQSRSGGTGIPAPEGADEPQKSEGNGSNPGKSDQIQAEKLMADKEPAGGRRALQINDGGAGVRPPMTKGTEAASSSSSSSQEAERFQTATVTEKPEEVKPPEVGENGGSLINPTEKERMKNG